jgi:hypothetical protein
VHVLHMQYARPHGELASRPTWREVLDEIDREGPALTGDVDTAALIRELREERDRELMARIWPDDPGP